MTLPRPLLVRPAAVFDGRELLPGAAVLVRGDRITAVGGGLAEPAALVRELPGCTLLPGLIDLHSHVLLAPYDRFPWADQVLRDSHALRVARAVPALAATLRAGFTTLRDLGTEGAGDADVGLRAALEEGAIAGPRLLCSTRAIVARGSYGPAGFAPHVCVPQGAQEVDGAQEAAAAVRAQVRAGADWIKVYADYRYGPAGMARPAFSVEELAAIVRTARDAGCPVAAHATTREGMRRAAQAGVNTVEHGNEGDEETFSLLAEQGVTFVPTLAASEALGRDRHESFAAALRSGVTIANGSDVGVFAHGENARELELLVACGMEPRAALSAATAVAANVLGRDELGRIAPAACADLVAVEGNPLDDITALRRVRMVMRGGQYAA